LSLCPEGQQCGCRYPADLGWQINSDCSAKLSWRWPEAAGCLLKSGALVGSKSGALYTEQLYQDPGLEIYPVGDIRNPECPGCGVAGADRDSTVETPVPGELFSLSACIDEETCISLWGDGGCHPIGSELFQTVGFMGGVIAVISESYNTVRIWVQDIFDANASKDFVKRILHPDQYPNLNPELSELDNYIEGFDPDGDDYDYKNGILFGAYDPESEHWGSIAEVAPGIYLILKGMGHPTVWKTIEVEKANGCKIKKLQDGRWYSIFPRRGWLTFHEYNGGYAVYSNIIYQSGRATLILDDNEAFNTAIWNNDYIYFANLFDVMVFCQCYPIVNLSNPWLDEEGNLYPDAYLIDTGGESGAIPCWSTDKTKYAVGDFVALAKIDTEFPVDEYDERVPVTNENVPTVGLEEYVIIPYQFAGAA
jgi:hypothetical protein